jgi:multiple sugar transport system substrate-binding protein
MRLRSVAALTMTGALLLAGCGSTEGDDGAQGTAREQSAASSVDLRWRTRPDNQAEIDLYQQISDDIDAEHDAFALKYEPGGSETSSYQDVLKTEIAAGTAPDVFWIPGTDVAGLRQARADPRPARAGRGRRVEDSDFYEGPMGHLTTDPETGQPADKLWGLPRDVSTVRPLPQPRPHLEAGVEDPRVLAEEGEWDWDAFEQTAAAITEDRRRQQGLRRQQLVGQLRLLHEQRRRRLLQRGPHRVRLDSPESIEGLSYMKGLYDKGLGVPVRRGRRAAVPRRHRRHVHERPLGDAGHAQRREVQLGRRRAAGRPGRQRRLAVLGRLRRQRQDREPRAGLRAWSRS